MRKITSIFLHCAAADINDDDLFSIVNQWHLNRGWSGCGYHYLIQKDGGLILARPIKKPGAHARGYNSYSVGIMLNGDTKFTKKQFETLEKLCCNLMDTYNLDVNDIYGHNEVSTKTCPNFDVHQFKQGLISYGY